MKNPLTDNLRCLSPLRAWRGELERTCLGSLFGDPDTVPAKVPLSLRKRERVRVRVRLDCMDTAQLSIIDTQRPQFRIPRFAVRAHQHLRRFRVTDDFFLL